MDLRTAEIGLVKMMVEAYSRHHHAVLRPDDVWIAILSQLNLYVNANAESLRFLLVQHSGQKELVVTMPGNRHTVDFAAIAMRMVDRIQENIVDPTLKDWILPHFSTSTPNDTVVCALVLMSTMQSYFEYTMTLCGLPSITLEGTKADWEKILSRIDRLPSFGKETTTWSNLLRPILRRFVQTFVIIQESESLPEKDRVVLQDDLRDFYSKVARSYSFGSGTSFLSGWIIAFCIWDDKGKWQGAPSKGGIVNYLGRQHEHREIGIDDIMYPSISTEKIPMGVCKVERVKVINGREKLACSMISGHVANRVTGENKDTLEPLAGWFIYVNPSSESKVGKRSSLRDRLKGFFRSR